MMRALRPVLRHRSVQSILCWLIAGYMRLVRSTGNWTIVGGEDAFERVRAGKSFIYAFWHGRLLMVPYARGGTWHVYILISNHPDGQLIAKAVRSLNITTIAGSTSKGGTNALLTLARTLKKGGIVGITPDGPRGPRMRASDGVVGLARLSGAPVYPVAYSASRGVVMRSWDRFFLPLPFSRGVFLWGPPIGVPDDADAETMKHKRQEIEDALNAVTEQADRLVGRPAVRPEPAGELNSAPAEH